MRSLRLLVLLLAVCALPAAAQLPSILPNPGDAARVHPTNMNAYGTVNYTLIAVSEFAFVPFRSTVTFDWSDGRFMTAGGGSMQANLQLPSGTLLDAWELEACDTNAAGSLTVQLMSCDSPPAAFCTPLDSISTGEAATPGCTKFFKVLPTPLIVQNLNSRYILEFQQTVFDGTARIRGVRLGLKRQVSPAPGFATFGDVPVGSALHQYVEALVGAGITAGCGDGSNFCPNQAITRGQMAVFLAKALGLNWPL